MQKMWRRKGNVIHILRECPVLEKVKMQTLSFARMDPEQIKEARMSGIVAFGKEAGLLNSPMNLNERYRAMGLSPGVPIEIHLSQKKKKKKIYIYNHQSKTFWKYLDSGK